jgi:hypothetical protein
LIILLILNQVRGFEYRGMFSFTVPWLGLLRFLMMMSAS